MTGRPGFQLPLSGSLERDGRLGDRTSLLSTPSLGITKHGLTLVVGTAHDDLITFNSLSRDHMLDVLTERVHVNVKAFNSLSRDHKRAVFC